MTTSRKTHTYTSHHTTQRQTLRTTYTTARMGRIMTRAKEGTM